MLKSLRLCLQSAEVTRKMLRDRHNKKNPTQPNPVFPNWVYDRPALIGDFIVSSTPAGDPPVAIGNPSNEPVMFPCPALVHVAVQQLHGKSLHSSRDSFPCLCSGTLSLPAQEQALVEDLLFVLVGIDGRDITAQPVLGRQNRSFIVDPTLDMSIKELVNRILPVASYYSSITR